MIVQRGAMAGAMAVTALTALTALTAASSDRDRVTKRRCTDGTRSLTLLARHGLLQSGLYRRLMLGKSCCVHCLCLSPMEPYRPTRITCIVSSHSHRIHNVVLGFVTFNVVAQSCVTHITILCHYLSHLYAVAVAQYPRKRRATTSAPIAPIATQ